jgi:DNA segregation ATPase FtsK/SpoIIIE-like protein
LGGAGFTGKTVGMRSFITSLIWSCSPEHLNLIIIDEPAELTQFSTLPHLSCPVIHDMNAGYKAIMKVYAEMKRRQKLKVENPEEYRRLPVLVCFVDECVSLVAGAGKKEKSQQLADVISQLLRNGRHAKVYTVLATQNPAINEMGCDLSPIKSRIAFTCAKPHNSVTILGEGGAEKLNGNGELYFISQRHQGLMYVKGAFIDAESGEIDMVCDHIRTKYETTEWDDRYKFVINAESLQPDAEGVDDTTSSGSTSTQDTDDKTLAKIIMWTLGRKIVSANAIYNAFKPEVGERKAKRFLERLQKLGIAGYATEKKACKVLITSIDDLSTDIIDLLNQAGHSIGGIGDAARDGDPNLSDEDMGDDFENDDEGEEG